MKRILLTVFFVFGIGYAATMPASATPMGLAVPGGIIHSNASDNFTRVHGYHRYCDRGWVQRWRDRAWHEHHRSGRISRCRPRDHDWRDDRRHHRRGHSGGCVIIGGIQICS